jgi:hypothetical protein
MLAERLSTVLHRKLDEARPRLAERETVGVMHKEIH